MEVFSTELGIRLSFVKLQNFGGRFEPPNPPPLGTPLQKNILMQNYSFRLFFLQMFQFLKLNFVITPNEPQNQTFLVSVPFFTSGSTTALPHPLDIWQRDPYFSSQNTDHSYSPQKQSCACATKISKE
jgi:hypothetical protein